MKSSATDVAGLPGELQHTTTRNEVRIYYKAIAMEFGTWIDVHEVGKV